jgi:hypothetical protein
MTLKFVTATLSAFATLAIVSVGSAGTTYSAGAYCSKSADGSGNCSGSFNGFQATPDPQAFAAFWNEGTTYAQFIAVLNGTYYACATTAPGNAWFTISSAPPTTQFSVSWDSTGACTAVSMQAGSEYQ